MPVARFRAAANAMELVDSPFGPNDIEQITGRLFEGWVAALIVHIKQIAHGVIHVVPRGLLQKEA